MQRIFLHLYSMQTPPVYSQSKLSFLFLQVESVFDDRRSVDTTLDKTSHTGKLQTCEQPGCLHSPNSNDDTETVTKHFVKQTTIVPRTNSTVIPC